MFEFIQELRKDFKDPNSYKMEKRSKNFIEDAKKIWDQSE